jgi:hypothetical protein
MSENHIRKTQVRVAERERRRAQQGRNERLKWQIPFAAAGVLALLAVAYFVFTNFTQPSQAVVTGVNGPHFQVDTEKLDLGDQPLGQTVHASFNVKNTGDGSLTLNPAQIATVLQGC